MKKFLSLFLALVMMATGSRCDGGGDHHHHGTPPRKSTNNLATNPDTTDCLERCPPSKRSSVKVDVRAVAWGISTA